MSPVSNNMKEKLSHPKGRVDVFGVPLLKRVKSMETQPSITYRVETQRRSSSKCDPSSNTLSKLSRAFSVHIQPFEEPIKELEKEQDTKSEEEYNLFVEELEKSRFASDADSSKIISDNVVAPNDPLLWSPFANQVAGHGSRIHSDGTTSLGILISSDEGQILKPMQSRKPRDKVTAITEIAFYSHITKSDDFTDKEISKWMPKFGGVEQFYEMLNGEEKIQNFLLLDNITHGLALPAIMDVKMRGPRWTPKDGTTKDILGFRVEGLRCYSLLPEDEGKCDAKEGVWSKEVGVCLKAEDSEKILETFFDFEWSGKTPELYDIIIDRLKAMLLTFKNQRKYILGYGSSILCTYDADAVRKFRKGKLTKNDLEKYVIIKLIDFGNVYHSGGVTDKKLNKRLSNLLRVFQTFKLRD